MTKMSVSYCSKGGVTLKMSLIGRTSIAGLEGHGNLDDIGKQREERPGVSVEGVVWWPMCLGG